MAKKKTTSKKEWDALRKPPEQSEQQYHKGSIHPDWHIFDGLFYPTFSAKVQFLIFNKVLLSWLERPQLCSGYDKDALDFYDGVIGYIIKTANYYNANRDIIEFPPQLADIMEIWQYKGYIYRAIDAPRSKIRYHKKIASWTKNADAFDKFNHWNKNGKYTFLIANTNDYYGFDVSKYNNYFSQGNQHIQHEEEVIFPMDKKYIIDVFYGTLDEFKAHVKQLNLIDKKD